MIPGRRFKSIKLIHTEKYVVAVEVEMVIPDDDPSEPCYEPETLDLLRKIKEQVEQNDFTYLTNQGKVLVAPLNSEFIQNSLVENGII